ncbi:MAG: S8/S53 family peptidase [Actinomycetota bacterium]|nr:S8/S53 family peptidase [Actinomycetota bacterium]
MIPRPAGVSLAALVAVAGLAVLTPAPAYADGDSCDYTDPSTPVDQRPAASEPLADLQIDAVHDQLAQGGRAPGAGAVVALLDSGISTDIGVRLRGDLPPRELKDWRGTAMAGVIAGPDDEQREVGFAPAAELVDVPIYDTLQPNDDNELGLTPDGVATGLTYLADNHASLQTDIAVVPMSVSRSLAMDAAIERLDDLDVIVVAGSGDRPTQEGDPLYAEYGGLDEDSDGPPSDEDAADDAWPAGYDNGNVVAVAAAAPDGTASDDVVLRNSEIDLAAPTSGLVGYGLNGTACVVPGATAASGLPLPGSGFAAAEVAGVLALMETAYDGETAEQLLARLYATATGSSSVTPNNVLTGHGIIQPLEALTRPLKPSEDGELVTSEVRDRDNVPVAVPESEPDPLASTRDNAAWWGLLGGGALLVAMVLRPMLARRR